MHNKLPERYVIQNTMRAFLTGQINYSEVKIHKKQRAQNQIEKGFIQRIGLN